MGGSSGLRQAIWTKTTNAGLDSQAPAPISDVFSAGAGPGRLRTPTPAWSVGMRGKEEVRHQSENGVSQAHGTVGPLPSPATARLTFLLLAPRQPAVPSERWRVKGLSLGKLQNAWETLGVSCVRSSVPTVRPHPRTPAAPTPQANVPPSQI